FVAIVPVDVTVPALLTVKPPLAPVLLMPVRVSGFAVLMSAMLPLVLLVALRLVEGCAGFKVCPVTELVVRVPVVLMRPAPLSLIAPVAPLAVRLPAPPPAAPIVPVMPSAPPLVTVSLPPPVLLMPVIVSGFAVLVSAMVPLVLFVAL